MIQYSGYEHKILGLGFGLYYLLAINFKYLIFLSFSFFLNNFDHVSLLKLLWRLDEISHIKGAYQLFLAQSKNSINLALLLQIFVIGKRWVTLVSAQNITSLAKTLGKMMPVLYTEQIAKNIISMKVDTGPILLTTLYTLPGAM